MLELINPSEESRLKKKKKKTLDFFTLTIQFLQISYGLSKTKNLKV